MRFWTCEHLWSPMGSCHLDMQGKMSYGMYKNDSILAQKAESLICSWRVRKQWKMWKYFNALPRNEENKGERAGKVRGMVRIELSWEQNGWRKQGQDLNYEISSDRTVWLSSAQGDIQMSMQLHNIISHICSFRIPTSVSLTHWFSADDLVIWLKEIFINQNDPQMYR